MHFVYINTWIEYIIEYKLQYVCVGWNIEWMHCSYMLVGIIYLDLSENNRRIQFKQCLHIQLSHTNWAKQYVLCTMWVNISHTNNMGCRKRKEAHVKTTEMPSIFFTMKQMEVILMVQIYRYNAYCLLLKRIVFCLNWMCHFVAIYGKNCENMSRQLPVTIWMHTWKHFYDNVNI